MELRVRIRLTFFVTGGISVDDTFEGGIGEDQPL